MTESRGWLDVLLTVVVFLVAFVLRANYVLAFVQGSEWPPFRVQDPPTADRAALIQNISDTNSFRGPAPMCGDKAVETAHLSPAHPYFLGMARLVTNDDVIIWLQCWLGGMTAVLYMLFARLQFGSRFVSILAGLLTAVHPFWIINVAEMQDGVLACFAVALCLCLGAYAGQRASPLASLLFGLSLAGMALVRAALLPFAFLACCLVLLQLRRQPRSWLCAMLVCLGFGNGLAPWTVRNYQVFGEIVPVTDTLFLHLWIGNNPQAYGGPQDDATLRRFVQSEAPTTINQAKRYRLLAIDVWQSICDHPIATIRNRFWSGLFFLFGGSWVAHAELAQRNFAESSRWAIESIPTALVSALLFMVVFGLFGWRWSFGLSQKANLASLAMIWIPLPYVLSHAESYSGPRLPLDGVLLCYAAFALVWMVPGASRFALPRPNSPSAT